MRAAVIGGGFAGRVHVQALRAVGVEPYLVITTKEESAGRFAREMGIPHWSGADRDGYSAAYAPEIDAVHVCTPPSSHAAAASELLRRGKPVLCEKPVALDLAEAELLSEAAASCGAPLSAVTFNVRYHMACQRAKEQIESGIFGRPILIHGNYMQEFHALPAPYDWRYDPQLGGKMRAVTEIGSHWIDLAQYVSGKKVTAVSAQTANYWPERVIRDGIMTGPGEGEQQEKIRVISEDAATVNLRFEDGAIGSVVLSEVSPGRGNRLTLEVTCENGNLWWNEEENNILYTAKKGEGVHAEIFAFGNGFGDTFEELLRRFYAALQCGGAEAGNRAEGLPSIAEGVRVAAVCRAILESSENDGRWTGVNGF